MNENQNEYVDINVHDNYPDSDQKIEIPTMKVIPLKKICMTIGALPTSYLETLSYYEMLVWFISFLRNNVIPTVNNNGEALEELQRVVMDLQTYINNYKDSIDQDVEDLEEYMNNYFENLDVQEEINNKLNAMVEDGTLSNIINQEIFGDLNKAVFDSNYYNLNYKTGRQYDTDYYIVTIPKYDENDNQINVYTDMENITPLQYAEQNKTTLTINAGLTKENSSNVWEQGIVIKDGEIINPAPLDIEYPNYYTYIGFNENREILEFQANMTTSQQMINAGVKQGYLVFYRYMNNGVIDTTHDDAPNWDVKSPRMDIGIKENGDLVILACDGRTNNNEGLLNTEALTIMQNEGCIKAWRCDGGGSTSLNLKGSKINRNIDDNGTSDRGINVTLNVKKETVNNERALIYNEIGNLRQLLNKQIRNDLLGILEDYEHYRSRIYCYSNDNSKNIITSTEAYLPVEMQTKYRHGENLIALRDENNKVIGITSLKAGLIRVVFIANFESSGSGTKAIRITKGNNDTIEWFQAIVINETNTVYKQMVCETVINHSNNEPLNIKFWLHTENVGDRFIRITAFAEELGFAAN